MNKQLVKEAIEQTPLTPELKQSLSNMVVKYEEGLCPFCNQIPGPFRNALSIKEHSISGLCQQCQDEFFGAD